MARCWSPTTITERSTTSAIRGSLLGGGLATPFRRAARAFRPALALLPPRIRSRRRSQRSDAVIRWGLSMSSGFRTTIVLPLIVTAAVAAVSVIALIPAADGADVEAGRKKA